MKNIFIGLFILVCIHSGCSLETKSKNPSYDFLGEWVLDDASSSAISRGCISLDLKDSIAKFTITKHNNNYLVSLNNEINTSWQSSLNRRSINASQILNTSTMGRFCGEQKKVRLILRLDAKSRNRITGKLEVMTCVPCPVVEFLAHKTHKK